MSSFQNSVIPPFAGDGVPITEENAHIYAPLYLRAVAEQRFGPTINPVTAAATHSADEVAPTNETSTSTTGSDAASNDTDVQPPDTTKYITKKNGQFVVPASEAISFLAHYVPGDKNPVQVEGYAWYCEKCYTDARDKSRGGKGVKGEFNHIRSVEYHFQNTHKKKWKFELPEPRREQVNSPNDTLQSEETGAVEDAAVEDGEDETEVQPERNSEKHVTFASEAKVRTFDSEELVNEWSTAENHEVSFLPKDKPTPIPQEEEMEVVEVVEVIPGRQLRPRRGQNE